MTSANVHVDHVAVPTVQRRQRRQAVEEARHSTELEGGRSGPQARALQDRYVTGELSADELVEQTHQLVAARRAAARGAGPAGRTGLGRG